MRGVKSEVSVFEMGEWEPVKVENSVIFIIYGFPKIVKKIVCNFCKLLCGGDSRL